MSFREVKELRKAGKLEEALQMANQILESEPDNIWNKRAVAWVYYDYLKEFSKPDSYNDFKENLLHIAELQFPEDEKVVFDNCAWQIGKMIFGLQGEGHVDFGKINELFRIIKEFHFTKPSKAYTFIYKAFHKGYQNWSEYLQFADWWGFENFLLEDYLKEKFEGNKKMSIVERAYIAYSKKLLEGEPVDPFGQRRVIDKGKIQSFLPSLDALIEKHPEYQYPPYFKAKLLLGIGSNENILSAFLPFAKQKRNDFWVWELMAELFFEDKEIQFSCYCKALSLKTPEGFLLKIRQVFAGMLIERNLFNEAKTEISKVIATREKHEWKIPNQVSRWVEQEWYKSVKAKIDNKDLYTQYVKKAEEILYKDLPVTKAFVFSVNKIKKTVEFVYWPSREAYKRRLGRLRVKLKGFTNYGKYMDSVEIGNVLEMKIKSVEENGYHALYSLLR